MRGSVVKKGNHWYVIIEQRDPQTGKRKRKWHSGFRTKREAEAARIEILSRLQRGTYIHPSRLTFGDYLVNEWLPAIEKTVRLSTHSRYADNARLHVIPNLGSVTLQAITPPMLNRIYSRLLDSGRKDGKGGLAPNTVRNVHVLIHKALNDAVRWGLLAKNPSDFADPPKLRAVGDHEMKTWTGAQVLRFLHAVEDDRLRAGWTLAATTGMRRGEVLGLRWQDVELDQQRLSVRQTLISLNYTLVVSTPKTARSRRTVALDRETVVALRAHRARQAEERLVLGDGYEDGDLVFCREDGAFFHPDRFSKLFRAFVADAGLPAIRLHDLRHTHATLALNAGIHPKVVSERLGHASVGITLDTYSHVLPILQEEAAEIVAAAIFTGR